METYRISSRLKENDREYLIQTTNDASKGSVLTAVFVDGMQTETVDCPHPDEINPQEVLALIKTTHGEKRQELETLLKAYQEVMERGDPNTLYQLGTAFLYKRFYREAVELLSVAVRCRDDYHQAWNHLAISCLGQGLIDDAVEAAEAAVRCRPGYADYRNTLGEAYLAVNSPSRAIVEFEQAIGINLYYGDAYFNLGLAYTLDAVNLKDREGASNLVERARQCLHKASLICADYKDHRDYSEGLKALENHDFGRALAILKGIRETRKERHRREFADFHMRFVLNSGWVTEEAITERIRFLENELEKNPGYVDLQAELAHCYLEQARLVWQKGVQQFKKTTELNPSLTRVAASLQVAEEARKTINEAVKRIGEKG